MKFAHLADCHLGAWRDAKLKDANQKAFIKAIDKIIEEDVDFVIIAGDLFNTSLPSIDSLKDAVLKLKELKDNDIPIYLVAGSHDFSPSGKTMLDVLENTGLFTNVVKGSVKDEKLHLKFTIDKKTGAKITGMLGKKGMLEKSYYDSLERSHLEKEDGYKIFVFHTAITELKPKELAMMDSSPLSLLPKNFNYYAGGHPHIVVQRKEQGFGTIAYPGPLFPNSFSEIEKLGNGGFYIIEDDKVKWEPVKVYNTYNINIDCMGLSAQEVTQEIFSNIKNQEFFNTIVTIRVKGTLSTGKISDIDFKDIFEKIYEKSAYFVMKNTNMLKTKDFEEIKVHDANVSDIESDMIKEHLGQIKSDVIKDEKDVITKLMRKLDTNRDEGEKVADYEKRIKSEVSSIIDLEL